jgi:hypothetical protein
MLPQINQEL